MDTFIGPFSERILILSSKALGMFFYRVLRAMSLSILFLVSHPEIMVSEKGLQNSMKISHRPEAQC